MAAPAIDFVSDMVCPWCFIGLRRLETALAGVPEPNVRFHPFQLDPETPPEGRDLRGHLAARFGDPSAMFARVEQVARESGIPLDFSKIKRRPNTLKAHTLAGAAATKGTQRALVSALFHAYFLDGADIGDDATLVGIATGHGFTEDEATQVLADGKLLAATEAEARGQAQQGIRGVPFVIFGEKLAVSGAQPVETFREAYAKSMMA